MMFVRNFLIVTLTVLRLPSSHGSEELYDGSITCSNSYPVQIQGVSAECDSYCSLGSTANIALWMSYSGISISSTKLQVQLNFEPTVNETFASSYYMNSGVLSHNTKFSEVVEVCHNGYNCVNSGEFYYGFNYQIPSFGNLDEAIVNFQLSMNLISYSYDSNSQLLGTCQAILTSVNSTTTSTVYASSSGRRYFALYAAAAVLGTFAALAMQNPQKKEDEDLEKRRDFLTGRLRSNPMTYSVPDKVSDLKDYVAESATIFWQETHSWPINSPTNQSIASPNASFLSSRKNSLTNVFSGTTVSMPHSHSEDENSALSGVLECNESADVSSTKKSSRDGNEPGNCDLENGSPKKEEKNLDNDDDEYDDLEKNEKEKNETDNNDNDEDTCAETVDQTVDHTVDMTTASRASRSSKMSLPKMAFGSLFKAKKRFRKL